VAFFGDFMSSFQIFNTGATITTGAASANVVIPKTSANASDLPKYVRVAATAACYVKIGDASVAAAAGDVLVQPGDAITLCVGRNPRIAAIQVTAAGICQISPLEDQ